jgi:outer membrane biosynthesis protein TonB
MIVPSTAAWAMRPGATNRLPAGITSAKPFPFPLYDQALIRSIYDRWHALLAAQPQPEANGRVFVDFDLHADGTISRLNLLPSPVSPRLERLCVQAVADSAPFAKWSPDMLAEVGADFRGIRIAFDFEGSTNASASGPANVTRAP